MNKIKKLIITISLTSIINNNICANLPAKLTAETNCAEKTAQVNTYVANVRYLTVLSTFISELQKIVQQHQNSIERYRIEMSENQKRIQILKNQARQKKESIGTLQKEIQDLLSNEQLQFKYLNNALCRHEGAKTILMASRILELEPEKYFKKASNLMKSAITIMESCGNVTNNPTSTGDISDNITLLEKIQSKYELKDKTKITQEVYSKRAAQIFANIQLRILNEYILLTQKERPYLTQTIINKPQPDPFPEIDASPTPTKTVVDNLIKRALFSAKPEIFEKSVAGITNRINTFIKQQEQDWLRDITLYKFGYQLCNCENTCKTTTDQEKQTCLQKCTEKTREQLNWQTRNCQDACKTAVETCQKFCATNDCTTACAKAKNTCLTLCTQDNDLKNKNWNYCVSCNKESEICARYQPLGLVDIQGEINALMEQIIKPPVGKPIPPTNIPAKIDNIMAKINAIKTSITDAQLAAQQAEASTKSTTINTLLPTDSKAKQVCATSLQTLLNAQVNTEPAKIAIKQLEQEFKKKYGDD